MHHIALTWPALLKLSRENFPAHISPLSPRILPQGYYIENETGMSCHLFWARGSSKGKYVSATLVQTQINRNQEARLQETGQDVWSCSCLSIQLSYANQWRNNYMSLLIPKNHNYAYFLPPQNTHRRQLSRKGSVRCRRESVSSVHRNSHQVNTGYSFLVPPAIIRIWIPPLSPWVY